MADLASSVIYGYLQVNDSITANNLITAPNLTLTQATGTAPMTITSTTLVSNLNVDYLDGQHGSYYLGAGNLTGTLSADRIANNSITLAKLETIPTATILGRNTTAEGNIEELSTATVKTMLNLTGTNSGDQNLFSHIHALNSSGTDVTNSPFNVTSSAEAVTLKAGTNVTLAMNTSGVVTITSAYTNTATAADGIFDGTNTGTEIKYSPYSTQQTGILSFDTSATAPTRTDRLNLNGYFYATQLYEGSTRALVRKTSDTTVTTHKFALFDTSSGDIIRSPITFNDSGTTTSELISASQVNTRIDNAVTGFPTRLRSNLLGTVSQTGGVPTGAVIESGSNANGSYVKFADGTMVCLKSVTTDNIATAWGVLYKSSNVPTGTFAAQFSDIPSCSYNWIQGSNGAALIAVRGPVSSTDGPEVSLIRPTSHPYGGTVYVTAIGRWF